MKIESLNNEKVKKWSKLNNKKYRDQEGLFLVEGEHLVNEAIKNDMAVEVIVSNDYVFDTSLPIYEVSDSIIKKISNQVSVSNVLAVCKKIPEKTYGGNLLLLDGIQDPGNLGTIIRSAVAFDIDTIILGNGCVDLYNDKTIRSSEGMIFNINFLKRDLNEFILELKKNEYLILGTDVESGIDIKNINSNHNIAILIGNEGNGVSENLKKLVDFNLYIKTNPNCESLNAGVAASILMYEIARK